MRAVKETFFVKGTRCQRREGRSPLGLAPSAQRGATTGHFGLFSPFQQGKGDHYLLEAIELAEIFKYFTSLFIYHGRLARHSPRAEANNAIACNTVKIELDNIRYHTIICMVLKYQQALSTERILPGGYGAGTWLGGLLFIIKLNGICLRPLIPRPLTGNKAIQLKFVDNATNQPQKITDA